MKEPPKPTHIQHEIPRPAHIRNISTPGGRPSFSGSERQPLLRRRSYDDFGNQPEEGETPALPLPGGTILGIHNLAIVMPQFIVRFLSRLITFWTLTTVQVALASSAIFRIVDGESPSTLQMLADLPNTYFGKNGVAWVLRFGGFCTLIGAVFARMVPPTPTEKAMRRRLGEMKLLGEEINP